MKILKKIVPTSLLHRLILIILIPALAAHIFTTYMFYRRHVTNVNNKMIESLSENISNIMIFVKYNPKINKKIIDKINQNSRIKIRKTYEYDEKNFNQEDMGDLLLLRENIEDKLNMKIEMISIKNLKLDQDEIIFKFEIENNPYFIIIPGRILYINTIRIFILWLAAAAILFSSLTIVFVNNQIAPLKRLSKAVEKFGKGKMVDDLKIEGAKEVRRTTIEFSKMKSRIEKHISQLIEMLAGVSHDLRTPITRIQIQLEMLEKSPEIEGLKKDLAEMEKMIQSYLDFAKGEESEAIEVVDISQYILSIINSYIGDEEKVSFVTNKKEIINLEIRANSFKRAIINILNNSLKFATKIRTSICLEDSFCSVIIEDNGCGIKENLRDEALKPFRKLDDSRNLNNNSGVGLGLSIAKNIINNHGGRLILDKSELLGGLKVIIKIPI